MPNGFEYTGIVFDWKAAQAKCGDALFSTTWNRRLFNQRADFCRTSVEFDEKVKTERGVTTVRRTVHMDEKSLDRFIRSLQRAADKLLLARLPGRTQASPAQELHALELHRSMSKNIKSLTEALTALEEFKSGMRIGRFVPKKGFAMPMSELA